VIRSLAGLFFGQGADLDAIISSHDSPRDMTILKLHPDAVAILRQPFAINHLPAGRLFLDWSYYYVVTRLLGVFREQAGPVHTDIIRVCPLFTMSTFTFCPFEAHHDDDRIPPFHSATQGVVQRHVAQTFD